MYRVYLLRNIKIVLDIAAHAACFCLCSAWQERDDTCYLAFVTLAPNVLYPKTTPKNNVFNLAMTSLPIFNEMAVSDLIG